MNTPGLAQNLHPPLIGIAPAETADDHLDSAMVSIVNIAASDDSIPIAMAQHEDEGEDVIMFDENKVDETAISPQYPLRASSISNDTHSTTSTSTTLIQFDEKRSKANIVLSLVREYCTTSRKEALKVKEHALSQIEEAKRKVEQSAIQFLRVDEAVDSARNTVKETYQSREEMTKLFGLQREESRKKIAKLQVQAHSVQAFSVHFRKIKRHPMKQQVREESRRLKLAVNRADLFEKIWELLRATDITFPAAVRVSQEVFIAEKLAYEGKMMVVYDLQREVEEWDSLCVSLESVRL